MPGEKPESQVTTIIMAGKCPQLGRAFITPFGPGPGVITGQEVTPSKGMDMQGMPGTPEMQCMGMQSEMGMGQTRMMSNQKACYTKTSRVY